MEFFKFLIIFLSFISVGVGHGHVADSAAGDYWQIMLPNTPMPQALLDALPRPGNINDAVSVKAMSSQAIHMVYNPIGLATLSQGLDDFGYEPPTPKWFLQQDVVTSIFFLKKDLVPEAKRTVHFETKSQGSRFPSPRLAQSMPPFSSANLPKILRFFSISQSSKAARVMNQTLTRCEHPNPINGEIQFCTTSLETMVKSIISKLRDPRLIRVASMPSVHIEGLIPYEVVAVRQLATERSLIACHKMSFPYGVFYCHQPRGATAYTVSLVGVRNRVRIDAPAMCHDHTSDWNPEYVAFKMLGVSPGTPICHFLQHDNMIWYKI